MKYRTVSLLTAVLSVIILTGIVMRPVGVTAGTSTATLTLTGTVTLSVTDSTIAFSNIDFASADTTTVNSATRYLYDSANDASDVSASFNEGTTNAKAYYYLNTTAFSAPSGVTVDNFNYALYKISGNTFTPTNWNGVSIGGAYGAYMSQNLTLTTASTTGSVTKPDAAGTVVGDGSATIGMYVSSDGDNWEYTTFTLYFYSDGTTLYFDDDADMSSADSPETGVAVQSVSATGSEISVMGNSFVLTSSIPTGTSTTFSLYIGWYTDETQNSVVGGTTMTYYMMFSLAFYGGSSGTYSVTTTITGSQQV